MLTMRHFALGLITLAPLGQAQALDLSETFALQITPTVVSDYRNSGISQTMGDPAMQLDLLLSHASGLYAGAWTSNVEYGYDWSEDDNYGKRQEVDYYAGYCWQITDDIGLDTYYNRYTYPGESKLNGSDIYLTLDAYGFFIGGKHSHDTDQTASGYFAGYRTLLPLDVGLELKYERIDYKDDVFFNREWTSGSQTYDNWSVGLQKDLFGVTWGLSYVDTDLSDAQCQSFSGYEDLCSATVVASASMTF